MEFLEEFQIPLIIIGVFIIMALIGYEVEQREKIKKGEIVKQKKDKKNKKEISQSVNVPSEKIIPGVVAANVTSQMVENTLLPQAEIVNNTLPVASQDLVEAVTEELTPVQSTVSNIEVVDDNTATQNSVEVATEELTPVQSTVSNIEVVDDNTATQNSVEVATEEVTPVQPNVSNIEIIDDNTATQNSVEVTTEELTPVQSTVSNIEVVNNNATTVTPQNLVEVATEELTPVQPVSSNVDNEAARAMVNNSQNVNFNDNLQFIQPVKTVQEGDSFGSNDISAFQVESKNNSEVKADSIDTWKL